MSIYHAFALGSHFEPQVLKQLLVELYFLDHMENICFHFGVGRMNDEGTKVTISC